MHDIEKLIKEQQKTNELLESLQSSKSFQDFLDKVEEVNPDDSSNSFWNGPKSFHEEREKKSEYKDYCKKSKGKKDAWIYMYINPDCLKWFYDYEKFHNIKDSIFQEAYSIIKKKKPFVLINHLFDSKYKPTQEEKDEAFEIIFDYIEGGDEVLHE